MKLNKWTAGLATAGVVSLASVVSAQEGPSTMISGYVSTSANWNPGTGNGNVPGYAFNSAAKQDGFNLDVVKVAIERPMDETQWSAGYKFEALYGPDANSFGTSPIGGLAATDFAIKQAYVGIRMPVGMSSVDWKLGVFDTVVGYESFDAGSNPNYTRSYGYSIEPTTHTGLLGTYRISDLAAISAGIANTTGPIIGGTRVGGTLLGGTTGRANPYKAESFKTYMGSVALTAPDSWGWLSGSTLYGGVVKGFGGGPVVTGDQVNFYAGATIATPVTGLRLGIAYDYFGNSSQTLPSVGTLSSTWVNVIGAYLSWQATEKLGVHLRGEYVWSDSSAPLGNGLADKIVGVTGTLQYDLWQNVISRLELRWDRAVDGSKPFGGSLVPAGGVNGGFSGAPNERNEFIVAANLIYKF